MSGLGRLKNFVQAMTRLADARANDEAAMLAGARPLLGELVKRDDWLPDACARPDPLRYRQYLLHCDPLERFSVVSFVWGVGQRTPVHNHTVWGLIGMLRGAEVATNFRRLPSGALEVTGVATLRPGMVEAVSPNLGDIHAVANADPDRPSISIHVYGANIGMVRRHVFDQMTGEAKDFVSGYSGDTVPNLWSMPA